MVFFLSLLALAVQVGLVAIALLAVVPSTRAAMVREVKRNALSLAASIAVVATLGSLYLSEGAHFIPCKLCWYQRIAMYASAVVLVLAYVRNDRSVAPYVIALAGLGGATSVYHMLVERFPGLESSACDPANPCSLIWTERFGYLTIPTMALTGFVAIIVLLSIGTNSHAPESTQQA